MQDSTKPSPSALPSVDRLVADAALTPFCQAYGRPFVTDLAREILAEARARLLAGETESVEPEALGQRIAARIEALMSAS